MAACTALDEDKVAVMLLLLVRMDRNRAVRIDTSLLPDFLTLSSERVDRAISSLIKNGWVDSVDERCDAIPCPRLHCPFSLHPRRLRYADEVVNARLTAVDVH